MNDIATKYALPPELIEFVQDGFLELQREIEPEQTIEFHIPSMLWTDSDLRATSYTLTRIHPDFNAESATSTPTIPATCRTSTSPPKPMISGTR